MVVSEPLHVLPSNKMGKLKIDEKGKNWKMQKMSEKTNEEKRKEHQRGNGAQEQQQDTDPTHTHTPTLEAHFTRTASHARHGHGGRNWKKLFVNELS